MPAPSYEILPKRGRCLLSYRDDEYKDKDKNKDKYKDNYEREDEEKKGAGSFDGWEVFHGSRVAYTVLHSSMAGN